MISRLCLHHKIRSDAIPPLEDMRVEKIQGRVNIFFTANIKTQEVIL